MNKLRSERFFIFLDSTYKSNFSVVINSIIAKTKHPIFQNKMSKKTKSGHTKNAHFLFLL